MDYEFYNLRPSQERRLLPYLETEIGKNQFIAKLKAYLGSKLAGGDAESDYVSSLAVRLSALGIWERIGTSDLVSIALSSNADRFDAFFLGLPQKIRGGLTDKIEIVLDVDGTTIVVPVEPRPTGKGTVKWVTLRRLGSTNLTYTVNLQPEELAKLGISGKPTTVTNARNKIVSASADEIRSRFSIDPDMGLLERIAISCGPSIYNPEHSTIRLTESEDLERVKREFLLAKLELPDGPELVNGIYFVLGMFGSFGERIPKVVFYYLLWNYFAKEAGTKFRTIMERVSIGPT